MNHNHTLLAVLLLLSGPLVAIEADESILLGDRQLRVTLDAGRHFALRCVEVDGTQFASGGEFPCFHLFDAEGREHRCPADEAGWNVTTTRTTDGISVAYARPGFQADVTYAVGPEEVRITIVPRHESTLKIRAISDGGGLLGIPATAAGARENGFLLRPFNSGELIRLHATEQIKSDARPQDWYYHASFFGLGYNGHGLIVRCPQYGAVWTAGTGPMADAYSLFGGCTADFRPRRDNPGPYSFWNLPLVEPQIELTILPVGDANGDGQFNWVDLGVAYRTKFIRRNALLDPSELVSISGKLDIWQARPNYADLIAQIRAVDWAPQRWWLVGPPVPVGNDFTYPCYADEPHPSHNGPDGYDYFQFKRDCAALDVKIGLHEMFQDVCPANTREWGQIPVRIQEYGEQVGTWNGNTPSGKQWNYSKALTPLVRDGRFFRAVDQHFDDWQVRPGDSWHWDCFTAFPGRADFSPEHPATHGVDLRSRIEILKYIQSKGIHISSEGLQEGLSEYCGFAWDAQTRPGWTSEFAAGEPVPLVPVLFQGMTYYYVTWHPAWNLLCGGKAGYEADSLNRDGVKNTYFGNIVFWAKIADRTVRNMIRTERGWRVEYTEGGSLSVDLADMTPAMSFVLEIDGHRYTAENPPPSPRGVSARWIRQGEYELQYPPNWKQP